MKALILAGGRGKRLEEQSVGKNKCMIVIKGRPAIEYSLNCVSNTDIEEIIIVVGYRAEEIINRYGIQYKNKKIKYVIQWEQKGLVHAIECAKDAISGDDFLLLLGDEILVNPRHQTMLNEFKKSDIFSICGILTVEDKELIKRTYTLIHDDNQIIYRLVEKPRHPFNNFMGTGDCVFRNGIFNYIDVTPIHHEREEKELPDLIQCAIDDGKIVKSFLICDRYSNINSEDDIQLAENIL
jgi:UDP-N-acetylglucosamine diphosphorylase / glucose-1-phosphate thymidylyltransferase / UDP-N-acetylgalactosamine diphosphorylase / glucosamine-1-phosphate N-acetyltransferase / galactosamine-1-phosphate N-acetyltransferase